MNRKIINIQHKAFKDFVYIYTGFDILTSHMIPFRNPDNLQGLKALSRALNIQTPQKQ